MHRTPTMDGFFILIPGAPEEWSRWCQEMNLNNYNTHVQVFLCTRHCCALNHCLFITLRKIKLQWTNLNLIVKPMYGWWEKRLCQVLLSFREPQTRQFISILSPLFKMTKKHWLPPGGEVEKLRGAGGRELFRGAPSCTFNFTPYVDITCSKNWEVFRFLKHQSHWLHTRGETCVYVHVGFALHTRYNLPPNEPIS